MKNLIQKIEIFFIPCKENKYRPSILSGNFLIYLTLILIIFKFVGLFYLIIPPKTPFFANVSREVLLQMTNDKRVSVGLSPLIENQKLIKAANLKAQDMLQYDYFSHWSPAGISPWHWFGMAGFNYRYAGENLAKGFLNARNVHNAWVDSPTHRDNILGKDFSEIGIAVVEKDFYGKRTFMVVQLFGTKIDEISPVIEIEKIDTPILEEKKELDITPIEHPIIEKVEEKTDKEIDIIPIEELDPVITGIENQKLDNDTIILGKYDTGVYLSAAPIKDESFKFSLFKFLMLEYDDILQQIIIFSMIFLSLILLINIFIKFKVQHPDLLFKGFGFLALFLIFSFFDQVILMRIIIGAPLIG